MRGIYKKLTYEDKFARKYYCNSYRFLPDMKRRNRRKLRRLMKKIEVYEWEGNSLRVKRDEEQ